MIFKVILFCVLFTSVSRGWFVKNWPVKAKGKITCAGHAMPYVYIKLMDKDFLIHDKMGTTRANSKGEFTVSGSGRDGIRGKPEPFIQVHYSYSGAYGKMKVVGAFNIVRKGKTKAKSYSSYINFGTINFSSAHCNAYVEFYKALKDFRLKSLHTLPYNSLSIRTNALIHGGTPYSTTSTIRIPGKYKTISYVTAKHELAHTIRHSYDGSFGHFLLDVIKYKYTQHHTCGKKTNYGFAFNEGWAEYWAGTCTGTYGSYSKDFRYEGNVAKRLRKLQKDCTSTYYKMVRVLRLNRKKIHSFNDFNNKHYSLYKCKV